MRIHIKSSIWITIALIALVLSVLVSAGIGQTGFSPPWAVVSALVQNNDTGFGLSLIVWELRLPRIFLAIFVGANLAIAGALMQALFNNPMAEPYVLGASSGASFGAVIAMVMGWTAGVAGFNPIMLCAFSGTVVATVTVYSFARQGGRTSIASLLLTGIAVSALLSAVTTLILLRSDFYQLRSALYWLMGGVAYRGWSDVAGIVPYTFICGGLAFLWRHNLNILGQGEETAYHLGLSPERARTFILVVASLLTAASVANSGIIAFVGLMAPHLARLLVGPNHGPLIPLTAIIGALLLVWADVIARTGSSGEELPLGVITGALGSLFFLYLLNLQQRRHQP